MSIAASPRFLGKFLSRWCKRGARNTGLNGRIGFHTLCNILNPKCIFKTQVFSCGMKYKRCSNKQCNGKKTWNTRLQAGLVLCEPFCHSWKTTFSLFPSRFFKVFFTFEGGSQELEGRMKLEVAKQVYSRGFLIWRGLSQIMLVFSSRYNMLWKK